MQKKDISIVIVNYNVKDFLLQCLRSVEKSLRSSFCSNLSVEIIVVDNNSNDASVEYLRPLFPEVKFIDLKENLGFGRANNVGFDHSNGKYVLILNPDTIIEENTLKVMFDYMESNSEVGVAGCKVLNPDGSFQLACRRGFPSPWSAFSKLFGLQKLFPKSKIFAGYNQTFRSEDETYYIDALIGAFMFARKEVLDKVRGFDPDFFMYGEDLDLCYRINQENQKIAYVHTTSIIHFKGESTKRSSMNEVKRFYEAMEIFAGKHFSGSKLFLLFLRIGIMLRAMLAYAANHKRGISTIGFDLFAVNASMLIATKIRTGAFLGFPDYAYPTVFIVLSSLVIAAMISVGEYFESKPTVTKSIFALMISFFVLSSLTYFFKEFASSRVIILMTIGFSSILTSAYRIILNISESISEHANRKLTAIVGENENSQKIAESLEAAGSEVVGIISNGHTGNYRIEKFPLLGDIVELNKIISRKNIKEVIITDPAISNNDLMRIVSESATSSVRFHVAGEFDEVLAAGIIYDITGIQSTVPIYSISLPRYKLLKRTVDIILSVILLTIGLPFLMFLKSDIKTSINKVWKVLCGKYSFIGYYPVDSADNAAGKPGLTGIAHLSNPERLSEHALNKLNNYYLRDYRFSLDIDIFVKFLLRKKSGI